VVPEVYEAYLKGRFALHKNTQVGFKQAIAHFQEAINREATFAPAYAGLAAAHSELGLVFFGASPLEVRPKVLAAASKALELDPRSLKRASCSQTRCRKTGSGRKPRRNTSKPLR